MACHTRNDLGCNGLAILGRRQIAVAFAEQRARAYLEGLCACSAKSVLGYLVGKLTVKSDSKYLIVGVNITVRVFLVNRAVGLSDCTVGLGRKSLVGIEYKGIGCKNRSGCLIGFYDLGYVALGIVCIIIAYSALVVKKKLSTCCQMRRKNLIIVSQQ